MKASAAVALLQRSVRKTIWMVYEEERGPARFHIAFSRRPDDRTIHWEGFELEAIPCHLTSIVLLYSRAQ